MGTQHQTSKMLLRALAVTLLVSLARGEEIQAAVDDGAHQTKAFSLFNVVTFKNLDCESTSTSSTNGKRNGTCYTSEECDEKGGVAAGSCAMGFGTCCLFTYQTCGTDVKQNCSYVRNEGFPTLLGGASATASTCNYKIEKCDPKVCTLRLDFESFNFANAAEVHLPNQRYSVCIRQEAGFCCNKYSVCSDANSFTLFIDAIGALSDSSCTEDFLLIEGASEICNSAETYNRFCGSNFAS